MLSGLIPGTFFHYKFWMALVKFKFLGVLLWALPVVVCSQAAKMGYVNC